MNSGYRRRSLLHKAQHGFAVAATEASVRVALASRDGSVLIAEFPEPTPNQGSLPYQIWNIPGFEGDYVTSLAMTEMGGTLLLVAGTLRGHLALWHGPSGEFQRVHERAHQDGIVALDFGHAGPVAVLASGGGDGVLRFWTPKLDELFRIEIGEPISAMVWTDADRFVVGTPRGVLALDLRGHL